jgi:hypothetical protein
MAVSYQHLRESKALHSNYYAATKKTASALKKRVRRGGRRANSTTFRAHRPSRRRDRTAPDPQAPHRRAIVKPCVDWPLLPCMKVNVQARTRPLDRFSAMPPRHEIAAPSARLHDEKNLRKALADGSSRRPRRANRAICSDRFATRSAGVIVGPRQVRRKAMARSALFHRPAIRRLAAPRILNPAVGRGFRAVG